MYENDADDIVDEIDRLIAWHAPVTVPAKSTISARPRLARDDASDAVAAVRRRLEVH